MAEDSALTCPPEKVIMVTVKGDRYGADIKEAIKTLDDRIEDFKEEAKVCDAKRLGRMEEKVDFLSQMVKDEAELRKKRTLLEDKEASRNMSHESDGQDRQTIKHEGLQVNVYNTYYVFLTANPALDSRTGKGESAQKHRW